MLPKLPSRSFVHFLQIIFVVLLLSMQNSVGALSIKDTAEAPADFPIVVNERAAEILVDKADEEVVRIAAGLLAGDIQRVSGVKPKVSDAAPAGQTAPIIVIGTLGKSAWIADLVKRGKLEVKGIEGKWETFVIKTVATPFPDVPSGLVIAGSDRRGAAYGALSLSEAVGVSPWEWWADVPPQLRKTLVVSAENHVEGPPSVKYRGIFINDEDWGLQEWAEKNYESGPGEVKDIGPKTYARVFELLLRLKANYCWPAMHPSTKAFNHYPGNKVVADRYAIVMGSSHAEPMLRNNLDEWPHNKANDWNPVTNLPGILGYWEQRVQENGKYENVYTVGMRGIHDSAMPGGGTTEEKRERLQKIIGFQREMLAKHVNPDPARVPQIFVPYKEVLELYQAGMKVPDDITLMWPDDNFGYIRQLPNAEERKRSGGSGIYYHLSYWGRPHDYLWLESTAPALIWSEMTKAYELGAQQVWVVNIGDIKPIEAGMTLFLQMAWDMKRYATPDVQQKFLRDFYAQQFGQKQAEAIAKLKDEYFRLCAIRRPEHMGFNRVYFSKATPNNPVQNSDWSPDESQRLLDRWLELSLRAEAMASKLPPEARGAYFQLVEYPACAGAAMAEKLIAAEKARLTGSVKLGRRAEAAFKRIEELTERYNTQNCSKWRAMMDYQPRKLPVFDMPPTTAQQAEDATPAAAATPRAAPPQPTKEIVIDAAKFTQSYDRNGVGWRVIEGLGRRGASIAVLQHMDTPTRRTAKDIRECAPVAEYTLYAGQVGNAETEVTVEALPTHPLTPQHELLAAVSVNDSEPVIVRFIQGKDDENDPTWQTNVLRSAMTGKVTLCLPSGAATIKLWAADPGVVIQRISLSLPNTAQNKPTP
jgi:hypothetical protein